MKKNSSLLSYLLGVTSIILLNPLLESFSEVLLVKLETLKAKSTIKVLKMNKEIAKLQQENEKENTEICTSVMGFQYNPKEEDWDEDDE